MDAWNHLRQSKLLASISCPYFVQNQKITHRKSFFVLLESICVLEAAIIFRLCLVNL